MARGGRVLASAAANTLPSARAALRSGGQLARCEVSFGASVLAVSSASTHAAARALLRSRESVMAYGVGTAHGGERTGFPGLPDWARTSHAGGRC
jgi:hypothetical protein